MENIFESGVVEVARKFVEEECKKPTSKYGYEPYMFHFVPVHDYAKKLAIELGADREVVEIAAWMHDIGSIMHGRENHHVTGAQIAESKLKEWNYPTDKIEKIKNCILHHRGSIDSERLTQEEQIVAEADSMSHFDNIGGIFRAALNFENHDQLSANRAVKNKLTNSYKKLSPKAKEIIKTKYDAAMLLL
jgi:putative nucleotidyltransferase with HDIG domain